MNYIAPDPVAAARRERLLLCLDGLSLGDAFGEMFFGSPRSARECVQRDKLPPGQWWYTDDTAMALAICDSLLERKMIDQGYLAERIRERFLDDPDRGYGKGTRSFCEWMNRGVPWQQAATLTFKKGSKGNGSAMRVAPVGAYFADAELSHVAEEARKSAAVTHSHPEGLAGAMAVAVAAAAAWRARGMDQPALAREIFHAVLTHTPEGDTRRGIETAAQLDFSSSPEHAAKVLGNGFQVSCPDTVPYVIWSAARCPGNYAEAILDTLAGGGDTDTTCAMVGGIVALSAGRESLPAKWLQHREAVVLE